MINKFDTENIEKYFIEIGMDNKLTGFKYLVRAMQLIRNKRDYCMSAKEIYEMIAIDCNVNTTQVQRDIYTVKQKMQIEIGNKVFVQQLFGEIVNSNG